MNKFERNRMGVDVSIAVEQSAHLRTLVQRLLVDYSQKGFSEYEKEYLQKIIDYVDEAKMELENLLGHITDV